MSYSIQKLEDYPEHFVLCGGVEPVIITKNAIKQNIDKLQKQLQFQTNVLKTIQTPSVEQISTNQEKQ